MKTKQLILAGLFAALTAIGAFLRIPMGASSFTLQVFFTCMAGVLLEAKYGALSQLVYVALGLVGLPIFTAGGGISYVLQPTFGFLLGLIPMAWVVGKIVGGSNAPLRVVGGCVCGLGVLYLIGMPYMALILNVYMGKGMPFSGLLLAYMVPFLPFDALKIAATALLAKPLVPVVRKGAAC